MTYFGSAVQRYAIAWAEREDAREAIARAQLTLEVEEVGALVDLRAAVPERERVTVRLLGGREVELFYDSAGIVVLG